MSIGQPWWRPARWEWLRVWRAFPLGNGLSRCLSALILTGSGNGNHPRQNSRRKRNPKYVTLLFIWNIPCSESGEMNLVNVTFFAALAGMFIIRTDCQGPAILELDGLSGASIFYAILSHASSYRNVFADVIFKIVSGVPTLFSQPIETVSKAHDAMLPPVSLAST